MNVETRLGSSHNSKKNPTPYLKFLFAQMEADGVSQEELARRTGISASTIRGWKTRSTPRLMDMEAALNAVGHELIIGVRRDLKPSVNNVVQLRLVRGDK
jgi:transcriptional regulator with XRE-family HTH domain